MHTPQTIVIFGTGDLSRGIANGLSGGGDRVLLCDEAFEGVTRLAEGLRAAYPSYDVEAVHCSYDAVWESDVIVLAVPPEAHREIAKRIRPVANLKVVINTQAASEELCRSLDNCRMVQAFDSVDPAAFYLPLSERVKIDCPVRGKNSEAVRTAVELVESIGFRAVIASEGSAVPQQI